MREHPAQELANDLLERAARAAASQAERSVRVMAETKAAKLASAWSSKKHRHEEDDLKGQGLPKNVQDAILDVEFHSHDIAERVALCEQLWETDPTHELALEPGNHPQTTWAQRFEFVDGEIVEITKESHDSPVKLVYRPDLVGDSEIDPASELQRRLQADPLPPDEA
jgi:hypothetical protein